MLYLLVKEDLTPAVSFFDERYMRDGFSPESKPLGRLFHRNQNTSLATRF